LSLTFQAAIIARPTKCFKGGWSVGAGVWKHCIGAVGGIVGHNGGLQLEFCGTHKYTKTSRGWVQVFPVPCARRLN